MKNKTKKDCVYLIELVNRATPDSINIAKAILKKNPEINISNLSILFQGVEQSLQDKANQQLSQKVSIIKKEIIEDIARKYKITVSELD